MIYPNGFSNGTAPLNSNKQINDPYTPNLGRYTADFGFNSAVYTNTSISSNSVSLNTGQTSGTVVKSYVPSYLNKWGNVKFTKTTPTNTTLTCDILDSVDNVLKTNVISIADISDIDVTTYVLIKVRWNLARNSISDNSPTLKTPSVTWEVGDATYRTYGVRIDTTNSNPLTSITYTDDAVGMTGGSATWDTMFPFNLIRPCVLNNPAGTVNYYLNPSNFAQKADLSASDITSGSAGDVMIEIPKMAYLINTTGNYLDIKITNSPDAKSIDANYCFNAFTRVSEGDRANLYVGAYLGNTISSKLRSLSGKAPTATQTIGTFRTQAQANGTGYDQVGFYPLILLQCLYLIRYKSLDSQTALGRGYVDANASAINTGGTNAKGMNFGEGTGKLQMKFSGIEDFWGNLYWWIDGLFCNASRDILTAFTNFNNTGSGYSNKGSGGVADLSGYLSRVQGSSSTGFIVKETNGSATTYFCDYAYLDAGCLPVFGGRWNDASDAGAFCLYVSYSASISSASIGGRLMFL